jgi:hypothetical protein
MSPANCGNFPTGLGDSAQFCPFLARKRDQSRFVSIGTIFAKGLPTKCGGATFLAGSIVS